jgi:hypothetical protein
MPTAMPRLALVIDTATKDKISYLATKHRRSTSAEICAAVDAWIAQHEEDMEGFEPSAD